MKQKFFSSTEVAKILGVSRIAVFKKIKGGTLKAQKVGRNYIIAKEDLIPHIKKRLEKERRIQAKQSTA
ncbi:MAG: helix-turn-helix domain-containing protein [Candidatus Harrisonbacteria bacterium]|nr:helix-turn-helix domain-containing protein [Candidatus Harrisonbacteria bacterium]